MPKSTAEAAHELKEMLTERDIGVRWVARRLDTYPTWVSRRLRGEVSITLDDYHRLKEVIELVQPLQPTL